MGVTAKKWVIAKKIVGLPTAENFKIVTEELPPVQDGGVLIEGVVWSVDPYMRVVMTGQNVGDVPVGGQVAKILESKNPNFPVGKYMVAYCGWRTHTVLPKSHFENDDPLMQKDHLVFSDMGNYPLTTAVGTLGMPGLSAYFGFLHICKPKAGDVVVVNAAGGAVGSQVCQIAKIKGCKVIAFAGDKAKIDWLKELGIDRVANYKTEDISKIIAEEAPKGVNCYFDNVGGEFTAKVLPHMTQHGRISVCGSISMYNDKESDSLKSPYTSMIIIFKQLVIEGFLVSRWTSQFKAAVAEMKKWIDEGKLKYKETVTKGFDNMPTAFLGLFAGSNFGKAVVTA